MNNKKTIILLIISIIVVIVATAGVTMSFFLSSSVQSSTNTLETTCYELDFSDSSSISLTSYPMSSTTAFRTLTPYNFTLTNSCESTTEYQIIINVLNTTSDTLLEYINYSIDGTTYNKLTSLSSISLPSGASSASASYSYVIDTGTLSGINASKEYNLYLWIDEDAGNDIMGLTFEAEVMVYGVAS